MIDELKRIKKIYGEEMMHLCRELFPSLLENPGLLLSILQKHLAPSRSFASDIIKHEFYEEFKNWVYSYIDVERDDKIEIKKNPFELMDEAGYILYECKTEEEIQSFKKYYAKGEELCTFRGNRLNRCHVFFAVKKNVSEIRREKFKNPQKQDEYGTSVISIQFSRGKTHDISIKNRYNHTVNNPDSTFNNNLDNIIPGLTKSFEKYCDFEIGNKDLDSEAFLMDYLNYIKANDGKFYRINVEINAIYYCENNIIIKDGEVITKYAENKERYILMDEFVLDLKEKKIFGFDEYNNDSFVDVVNNAGIPGKGDKITNISIRKYNEDRIITIDYINGKKATIVINKNNSIIDFQNDFIEEIGDNFLCNNSNLCYISLQNVKLIGSGFLYRNERLRSINLPNVEVIMEDFLYHNYDLIEINLPKVKIIENNFLFYNNTLSSIDLPMVEKIGYKFLHENYILESINVPKLRRIGYRFLFTNNTLLNIDLPSVDIIHQKLLYNNSIVSISNLPDKCNVELRDQAPHIRNAINASKHDDKIKR